MNLTQSELDLIGHICFFLPVVLVIVVRHFRDKEQGK